MALIHTSLICLLVLAVSLMCYAERSSDSDSQDAIMTEYFARGVGPYGGGTNIKCPGCPMNPGTCSKCCNKAGYKSGGACGGFLWKKCLCVGIPDKPTDEPPYKPTDEPPSDADVDLAPEDSPMGQNFARGAGPYGGTNINCPGCPTNPGTCSKCCNKAGYKSGGACGGFLWNNCLCVGTPDKPTDEPPSDADVDLALEDSPMGQNFARGAGPYGGTNINCPGCPTNPGTCSKCCNKAGYKSCGSCGGFMWKNCLCAGTPDKPTEGPAPDTDGTH